MNLPNYSKFFYVCESKVNDVKIGTQVFLSSPKKYKENYTRFFSAHKSNNFFYFVVNSSLDKSRVFKIPKNLTTLFTMTDNKPRSDMRLPFPIIFLETKIPIFGKYKENESITKGKVYYNGLLLREIPREFMNNIGIHQFSLEDIMNSDDVEIQFFGLSESDNPSGFFDVYETQSELKDPFPLRDMPLNDENEFIQLRSFIANFLDFLDDPEVKLINKPPPKRRNEIRKRKGLFPLPPCMTIRIPHTLKKYMTDLQSKGHFVYSHRFWVRGHWRRFRSDYFKNVRGQKKWIKPFLKGTGILVGNKRYQLENSEFLTNDEKENE